MHKFRDLIIPDCLTMYYILAVFVDLLFGLSIVLGYITNCVSDLYLLIELDLDYVSILFAEICIKDRFAHRSSRMAASDSCMLKLCLVYYKCLVV